MYQRKITDNLKYLNIRFKRQNTKKLLSKNYKNKNKN